MEFEESDTRTRKSDVKTMSEQAMPRVVMMIVTVVWMAMKENSTYISVLPTNEQWFGRKKGKAGCRQLFLVFVHATHALHESCAKPAVNWADKEN
jgi:hypothetical protein